MGTKAESIETRRVLIEAAGPLFAERGFAGVTVRQITTAADTQLSAINYHFRDKEGLYQACIEFAFALPQFEKISKWDFEKQQDPRLLLRQIVHSLLGDFRDVQVGSWQHRLYLRLMIDQNDQFDWFDKVVKPKYTMIRAAIAGAGPDEHDPAQVDLATFALFGLLDNLAIAGPLFERAAPALAKAAKRREWLLDSIVDLTLAGLKPRQRN